jgi:hypothetical protein
VLITEEVWIELKPPGRRKEYPAKETIHPPHDPPMEAYRRQVVKPADETMVPPPALASSAPSNMNRSLSPVGKAYVAALCFAKLLHHHFHTLEIMGVRVFERAARAIAIGPSPEQMPVLITQCQEGWNDSEDARGTIDWEILQQLEIHIPAVQAAFGELVNGANGEAATKIALGFGQLDQIKLSISAYQNELFNVAAYDIPHADFGRDTEELRSCANGAMALSRRTDKLIAKADVMIKHLLDAMQIDPRL